MPRARNTFALPVADLQQGLTWASATVPTWMVASSVVLCSGVDLPGVGDAPYALLFTLEGLEEDIATEADALRTVLKEANAPALIKADNLRATTEWANFLASGGDEATLVRVGLPAGRVSDYWAQLPAAVQAQAAWCADVGNNLLYARADFSTSDATTRATWLAALRKPALGLGGYAIVMATPHDRPRSLGLYTRQPRSHARHQAALGCQRHSQPWRFYRLDR